VEVPLSQQHGDHHRSRQTINRYTKTWIKWLTRNALVAKLFYKRADRTSGTEHLRSEMQTGLWVRQQDEGTAAHAGMLDELAIYGSELSAAGIARIPLVCRKAVSVFRHHSTAIIRMPSSVVEHTTVPPLSTVAVEQAHEEDPPPAKQKTRETPRRFELFHQHPGRASGI